MAKDKAKMRKRIKDLKKKLKNSNLLSGNEIKGLSEELSVLEDFL